MLSHRDRRGTRPWPKSRPPLRGRPEKAAGYVERLVRATSPACTALLAGGLLRTITAIAGTGYGPWGPNPIPATVVTERVEKRGCARGAIR